MAGGPDDNVFETTDAAAQPAFADTLQFPGTARFEVRQRLGSGAFGTVYECFDRDLKQSVALKVLRQSDAAFLYRFKREFRALVDLRHANLVQLFELFSEGQFWFFSMEFVRGLDFLHFVEAERTDATARRWDRLREMLGQLSDGIVALHERGILHRDIKPANVLVSAEGRVKLLDFGLVHELEWSDSHSAVLAGTPAYMAPERLALQSAGTASDWYSVGVMLFEAITGSLPFTDTRFRYDTARSMLSAQAEVPVDLRELCFELLNRDPARRPSSGDVRRRLAAAAVTPGSRHTAETDVDEPVVVGREREMARLTAALEDVKRGRAVVVNVSGQSGIGKTTVLRAIRRQLVQSDSTSVMLVGRCHENESVPFKALDDLIDRLSQYLRSLPASEADVLTPRDASALVRMFPVLGQVPAITRGRHVGALDAVELRQRAFGSLQDLIARLADRKTLVLALDDLQWGDLDSAAFLGSLFGGPAPPPLLLIAAYRAEDRANSLFLSRWHTDLAAARSIVVEDLPLGELTFDDSRELATKLLDSYTGRTDQHAAESVVGEAGGSPFLIEHLVRSIRDHAGRAEFDIHQAITDRLNELPLSSRHMLETLATAGRPLAESVACRAAEWHAADRPALHALASEHLVRIGSAASGRYLEVYHDKLREHVLSGMPAAARQRRHQDLALALEQEADADSEAVATHWRHAGQPQRASVYAVAAGDRASHAVAFDRAADWYRVALDTGTWSDAQRLDLRRKLAAAFAHAGRSVAAADVFLEASRAAVSHDRWELQRLAGEQLLRGGHVERGLAVLETLGRDMGIWMPSKPWLLACSFVWHRFLAELAGAGTRGRLAGAKPERVVRLDVYWAFAIGLSYYEPKRAMDFHARHLFLARRVGDAERLARALAMEASARAAFVGRETRAVRALLAQARALYSDLGSAQDSGFIPVSAAFCALQAGDWRRSSELAEEADRLLAEHHAGVGWERTSCLSIRIDAAFQRGEWAALSEYAQQFALRIDEARGRGDNHAMIASLLEGTLRFLIADDPSTADRFVRESISSMPENRFLSPNAWAFLMQVLIALYSGDKKRACTLAETTWPTLAKSPFLSLQYEATMAWDGYGRTAIAGATIDGSRAYVKTALACAQELARRGSAWANALSLLIRAGVASLGRDRAAAIELLREAERGFRACGMAHYVAACEYRRGMLAGGEEGRALVAAAEQWASAQRIVNPSRVFDMLAVGRWESL